MDKKKRLLDATKRIASSNVEDKEILKGLEDIGVPKEEADELLGKAREEDLGQDEGESFWDSKGKFFKRKVGVAEEREGVLKGILKPKQEEAAETEEEPAWKKSPSMPTLPKSKFKRTEFREILPVRVSKFDLLIERGGLKRGDTIMLSGGCGTGKTTFGMQSLYNGALHNEKGIYLTLEESAEKMKENMMHNFGWDLDSMEREGKMAIIKIDPLTIARAVEATLTKERGGLYIEFEEFELPFQLNLPFKPDRVVVDSLSALSIAFMENEQAYRMYLRHLFETLEKYRSCNIVLGETEQEPGIYSRSGIEEFLADGVVVLYNIKIHNIREKALEILKLRSSNHEKKITPYKITSQGIEVYIGQELFREE